MIQWKSQIHSIKFACTVIFVFFFFCLDFDSLIQIHIKWRWYGERASGLIHSWIPKGRNDFPASPVQMKLNHLAFNFTFYHTQVQGFCLYLITDHWPRPTLETENMIDMKRPDHIVHIKYMTYFCLVHICLFARFHKSFVLLSPRLVGSFGSIDISVWF